MNPKKLTIAIKALETIRDQGGAREYATAKQALERIDALPEPTPFTATAGEIAAFAKRYNLELDFAALAIIDARGLHIVREVSR